MNEASWFAVRDYGGKTKENTFTTPIHWSSFKPTSNVHPALIYVTLENHPDIEKSARSRIISGTWLARLEDLQTVLTENNLDELAKILETPNFDVIPKETLANNRQDLLKKIQVAKTFFGNITARGAR